MKTAGHRSDHEIIIYTPYFSLRDELWSVLVSILQKNDHVMKSSYCSWCELPVWLAKRQLNWVHVHPQDRSVIVMSDVIKK